MSNRHLIFDFDGTLVDSYHCLVKKFILLADEFDFYKLNEAEIEKLRDLSSKEVIQFLKIPLYKIPKIIRRARAYVRKEIPTLQPIPKLTDVLIKLHEQDYVLSILTSNSKENVLLWLEQNNLTYLFKYIQIESSFFSKKTVLKKMLKTHKIHQCDTCYIGDETRDIEAAKANDIYSIAVTWGYNTEAVLAKAEPQFIARQPEDLLLACR